jgi:hypothetical protein
VNVSINIIVAIAGICLIDLCYIFVIHTQGTYPKEYKKKEEVDPLVGGGCLFELQWPFRLFFLDDDRFDKGSKGSNGSNAIFRCVFENRATSMCKSCSCSLRSQLCLQMLFALNAIFLRGL